MGNNFRVDYDPNVNHLVGGNILNRMGMSHNRLGGSIDASSLESVSDFSTIKAGSPPPDKAIGYVQFTHGDLDEDSEFFVNECPDDPVSDGKTAQCFDADFWKVDFIWFDHDAQEWLEYELDPEFQLVLDARGTANVDSELGHGAVPYWRTGERILAIFNELSGTFTPLNYGPEQTAMMEFAYAGEDEAPEIETNLTDLPASQGIMTLTVNGMHAGGRDASFMIPSGCGVRDGFHTIHGSTSCPIRHGDVVALNIGISDKYKGTVEASNWGFRMIPIGRLWHPRDTEDVVEPGEYEGMQTLGDLQLVAESLNRYKDTPYPYFPEPADPADPTEPVEEVEFRFLSETDPLMDFDWTCIFIFWCELKLVKPTGYRTAWAQAPDVGIAPNSDANFEIVTSYDGGNEVGDTVTVSNTFSTTLFETGSHQGTIGSFDGETWFIINEDRECE